ncbi:hypothetical protein EIN_380930 [Entamoeba invadens IP1]|uniref:Uncharacterized protein n=1 Tax=Entamoeba invadens IP1 TaxID=370355 RepID=A0A0A1UEC3_ENTIV|nr:hypothetical protein EIN_380930 [Entamoeba invadens IP1]ELP92136.1 hypothetical protein EIN_380930 [Entamoeba invadens IP1]|eukprot:XP_004258907.1 hypothetical protein EIN_380930 [Entamoeba invadens IP1]
MEKGKTLKMLLVGESSVGKTSLTQRYISNTFDDIFLASVGVDFKFKEVTYNNEPLRVQLWDTAGQERFRSIGKSYYRNADVALVVFDLNNFLTFQKASYWLDEIRSEGYENTVVIVGNKNDLESKVEDDQITKAFPDVLYVKVSAKTGNNVEFLFDSIVKLTMQKVENEKIKEDTQQKEQVIINFPKEPQQNKSSCC